MDKGTRNTKFEAHLGFTLNNFVWLILSFLSQVQRNNSGELFVKYTREKYPAKMINKIGNFLMEFNKGRKFAKTFIPSTQRFFYGTFNARHFRFFLFIQFIANEISTFLCLHLFFEVKEMREKKKTRKISAEFVGQLIDQN